MLTSDAARNPSAATPEPQPKRVLGLRDLVLFYIAATINVRWLPVAAAAGPSTIVIWVIGVITIFLPVALAVMELSSRYPQEGGMYVWSKHAFGDFGGYMTGWIYWMSNLPYYPAVLYFAASNVLYVGGQRWKGLQGSTTFFITFSLLGLGLALILNIVGLNVGKWLSNLGAIGIWIPIAILCLVGAIAWRKFGSATSFTPDTLKPSFQVANFAVWATLMGAFTGAEAGSFMGAEIKNARRIIPRALLIAGVLITAGYLLGTIAILIVLPHGQLSSLEGVMQAISIATARIGWGDLGSTVALLICIANLGAVGAYLASTSRIPFVVGIDRYLPHAFAKVHPRWGTPYVSLIVQGLCCVVFVFLGQLGSSVHSAYDLLVSMTVITTFLPYIFMFGALIRLQREPVEAGVVRIPGGKPMALVLGLLGSVATIAVIVGSVIPDPGEPNKALTVAKIIGLNALVLGSGALLYWSGRRAAKRAFVSDDSQPEATDSRQDSVRF